MTERKSKNLEPQTKFVMSQKMGIRDFFRLSVCAEGLHVWIPPNLIKIFKLESGDEVYVRIDEVRYSNLREISV